MNTNDKMTLREALELALRAHDPYAGMAHYKARDRARDILLAAVEAHEAFCSEMESAILAREQHPEMAQWMAAMCKLRDLEAGKESEVQP